MTSYSFMIKTIFKQDKPVYGFVKQNRGHLPVTYVLFASSCISTFSIDVINSAGDKM